MILLVRNYQNIKDIPLIFSSDDILYKHSQDHQNRLSYAPALPGEKPSLDSHHTCLLTVG